MDDRRLLREYIENRSDTAFAALSERHLGLVYGTCLRELRDRALAEDATQIVFLILAQRAKSLRSAGALASWLFTTARFTSRSLRTQELRRKEREERANEESRAGAHAGDWEEIAQALNDALAALKDSDRQILLLRFFEGASFKEAGEELKISENTARVRSKRAIERLRRLLAHSGAEIPAPALVSLLTSEAAKAAPSLPRPSLSDPRLHHLAKGAIKQVFLTNLKIAGLIATAIAAGVVGVYTAHNRPATIGTTAAATADSSLIKLISGPASDSNLAGSQILQQCRKAYDSVQTFQQDAQSSIRGVQGTAHIIYQRPGNLRVTGATVFSAVPPHNNYDLVCRDGSDVWVYNAGKWSKERSVEVGIDTITAISGAAGSGVPSLLLHSEGEDVLAGMDEIDSVATEMIGGRNVYRVSGTVDNQSTTLWIDQKTFFLVKSRVMAQTGHGTVPITVTYSSPKINEPIPASEFVR